MLGVTHGSCSATYFIVVLCCVARNLCSWSAVWFHVVMFCVNMQLMFLLAAACSCLILHMAGDFVLRAKCLCFCFVRAHGFCLCFLCAMCSHVNCLDPNHQRSLNNFLICFLFILLVFAVLCQFILVSTLRPVSERRLSENSEYVNPEMRETLCFPFQNGRFVKPGKAG